MAFDQPDGYVAASNIQDGLMYEAALPIFDVQRVQMRFDISSDFVAAQVANNVLILALSTGRILRFDLDNAEDIDDIDLPKRPSEIGVIRKLFLDPSASHLIITTNSGENYYLHTQSRQPKALARLKGVHIESVAWNPSQPTASTREILIGALDGNIYETYIEPSTEFYRREEKYVKAVFNVVDGAVVGLHIATVPGRPELRKLLVATPNRLLHFVGRSGRHGDGSMFTRLFEHEVPAVKEAPRGSALGPSVLAVSPETDTNESERAFAWLCGPGVFNGPFTSDSQDRSPYKEARMMSSTTIPLSQTPSGRNKAARDPIASITLTQFHILSLVDGRIVAVNRLDDSVVYDQIVLDPGQSALGLFSDEKKNTYWLFTQREIYEIVVTDEARDVWKIMLKNQQFDAASKHARTSSQKDAVATASGDHLISRKRYSEAAAVYGRSSKPFEEVALTFIDNAEPDALRRYLLTKLSTLKKSATMQRIMVASWLVELFMAKLNLLDDTISAKAELAEGAPVADAREDLPSMRKEYQDFINKYKSDLDRRTTYELINSHGREEELLHYANAINDYNYVLSYWVQRERWQEAMSVLRKQKDADIFYQYSSVLMTHMAVELVEVMMRQTNLEAKKLIPALLNYNNKIADVPLNQNQAVRYLLFCINQHHSTDPAVHNTLVSIYAAHPSPDESPLYSYLTSQSTNHEQFYDADFALRLCIAHTRVQSCVHIYCTMEQYSQAVDMALKHENVDLAAIVADRPGNDPTLRKKLWLKVAKKIIGRNTGIKAAMEFLKRCELLRIEDLIPFFPDFVVIDDFKEEICAALEEYSRQIDGLKREMDDSAATAEHIKDDIKRLDSRYAIVEPGERCWSCRLPLLMRAFYVFPCQHGFHADCLGKMVLQSVGMGKGKRIRELQAEVGRAVVSGKRREGMVRELDGLVAGACVLCSEMAVKRIDEPFVSAADNKEDWAI